MNDKPHTIVFLGPTLDLEQAKALLPDAQFMPPVQCGDVLRVLHFKPKPTMIAIIDGYFQQTAAVWHKEILYAIQQGVTVYGASSMGALRAAELHIYGMQGIGDIFAAYRDGQWEDDDEVAVAHTDAEQGYRLLSDAMINIRATVQRAVEDGVLTALLTDRLLTDAKAQFYRSRQLKPLALSLLVEEKAYGPFVKWLEDDDHFVNQKQRDAIALLEHLAQQQKTAFSPSLTMLPPMFFRTLRHHIDCDAMEEHQQPEWFRSVETMLLLSNGDYYNWTKRLAALLAVVAQFPIQDDDKITESDSDHPFDMPDFYYAHNDEATSALYKRILKRINHIIAQACLTEDDVTLAVNQFLHANNMPPHIFTYLTKDALYWYAAILWCVILKYWEKQTLSIDEETLLAFSSRFRQQHKLLDAESFEQWLDLHQLTTEDYQAMITSAFLFDFIVARFNIDCLIEQHTNYDCWWFGLAFKLAAVRPKVNPDPHQKTSIGDVYSCDRVICQVHYENLT